MSLADAIGATLADWLKRDDASAWQKSAEVAELQAYLRSAGRPHSTRELARLLHLSPSRVSEQLTIASELDENSFARYGVSPAQIAGTDHRTLLRIAKLPHYLRDKVIRDSARDDPRPSRTGSNVPVREQRRTLVFSKLRDEGQFLIDIPQPIVSLTAAEAGGHLNDFLPALAHLAEIVKGRNRSHYIGLAGNGGIVIYLSPSR